MSDGFQLYQDAKCATILVRADVSPFSFTPDLGCYSLAIGHFISVNNRQSDCHSKANHQYPIANGLDWADASRRLNPLLFKSNSRLIGAAGAPIARVQICAG